MADIDWVQYKGKIDDMKAWLVELQQAYLSGSQESTAEKVRFIKTTNAQMEYFETKAMLAGNRAAMEQAKQ